MLICAGYFEEHSRLCTHLSGIEPHFVYYLLSSSVIVYITLADALAQHVQ